MYIGYNVHWMQNKICDQLIVYRPNAVPYLKQCLLECKFMFFKYKLFFLSFPQRSGPQGNIFSFDSRKQKGLIRHCQQSTYSGAHMKESLGCLFCQPKQCSGNEMFVYYQAGWTQHCVPLHTIFINNSQPCAHH